VVNIPEGKILYGRPRHRWNGDIDIDVKERGCEIAERFLLTRVGAMAGFCEHGYIKVGTFASRGLLASHEEICSMDRCNKNYE
jgi:hypothetical protein